MSQTSFLNHWGFFYFYSCLDILCLIKYVCVELTINDDLSCSHTKVFGQIRGRQSFLVIKSQ